MAGDGPEDIICIYAPNELAERVAFFDSLIAFINSWGCEDYVIFGDFNSVMLGNERWDCNGYGSASEELCFLVESLELYDIPLYGSSFTYFGNGQKQN